MTHTKYTSKPAITHKRSNQRTCDKYTNSERLKEMNLIYLNAGDFDSSKIYAFTLEIQLKYIETHITGSQLVFSKWHRLRRLGMFPTDPSCFSKRGSQR